VGRRLILDTVALIDMERGMVLRLRDDDELAIAAISVAEFARGSHTAAPATADQRRRFLDNLLTSKTVPVLPYTTQTAYEHAYLLHDTARSGQPRGAHDLIIAAHARESGRMVYSADRKARFEGLPGVTLCPDEPGTDETR
jgi:predicted nucleic acid-binding protein